MVDEIYVIIETEKEIRTRISWISACFELEQECINVGKKLQYVEYLNI